jgi:hypothetical protein
MIVCVDTNTVVQALAQHHPFLLPEDAHFAPLAHAGYRPRPMSPQQFIAQYVPSGG